MTKNKGFTLIELMVVILIVAILAAVLAPMMTGRIRQAKWSEGRAGAGTIATGIRAWCAERGLGHTAIAAGQPMDDYGVTVLDLKGKYFSAANYGVSAVTYNSSTGSIGYLITITPGTGVGGNNKTLNSAGSWNDL